MSPEIPLIKGAVLMNTLIALMTVNNMVIKGNMSVKGLHTKTQSVQEINEDDEEYIEDKLSNVEVYVEWMEEMEERLDELMKFMNTKKEAYKNFEHDYAWAKDLKSRARLAKIFGKKFLEHLKDVIDRH